MAPGLHQVSHLSQEIVLKSLQSKDFLSEKDDKFRIMYGRAQEVKRGRPNNKLINQRGRKHEQKNLFSRQYALSITIF